jgi:hypothetical protein
MDEVLTSYTSRSHVLTSPLHDEETRQEIDREVLERQRGRVGERERVGEGKRESKGGKEGERERERERGRKGEDLGL